MYVAQNYYFLLPKSLEKHENMVEGLFGVERNIVVFFI